MVERSADVQKVSEWSTDGNRMRLASVMTMQSESIGAGLGLTPGQFVSQSVRDSRTASDQDIAWILGREGRTELNADGLLADPSLFATDPRDMVHNPSHAEPEKPRPARGFTAQLRHAAERLHKGGRA